MSDFFARKRILVISPQAWDHLKISKHHYAMELARRGNTVFFLEPPRTEGPRDVEVLPADEVSGIHRVSYRPWFPYTLRFHFRRLFDYLMLKQIREIAEAIGEPLDIVWSFEPNLYSNLRAFHAPLTIYHPVDVVLYPYQISVARSADIVFSVSQSILRSFDSAEVPLRLINHGLAEPFARVSRSLGEREGGESAHATKRVGYAGNLSHPALNRPMLQQVIGRNPEVEFHFWCPSLPAPDAQDQGIPDFFRFLKQQTNVRLHGELTPDALARELSTMDCLILCYSCHTLTFDCSNSHKILEYLSTGKVVVGTRIEFYDGRDDLLRMTNDSSGEDFPELLENTLMNLESFNSKEAQRVRREYALAGTYEHRVNAIAEEISRLHERSAK